jgi:hypothetical protein
VFVGEKNVGLSTLVYWKVLVWCNSVELRRQSESTEYEYTRLFS